MSEAVDPVVVAIRFVVYLLGITAFGQAIFEALKIGGGKTPLTLRVLVPLGFGVACVAYLAALASEIGGALDPAMVYRLVRSTGFGRALAISALAALITALGGGLGRTRTTLIAAGVALAALAFVGHAADGTGTRGLLRLVIMALHLLAIGAWVGALPSLLVALQKPDAAGTVRGFGNAAALALAVVLGTGLVSLAFVVAGAQGVLGPGYLRALGVKLGFVVGLVAIAALNRFALTPRIAADPARTIAILRWSVVAEQALGLGAIGAVALLGQLDPGM